MAWSSFFKNSPQPPGAPPAQAPGNVPTKSTAPSSFYPTGGIYPETLAPDGLLAQLNADLATVANAVSICNADAALATTYANASAVRYDIAQALTSPQQVQARSNIGLAAVAASGSASDLTTGTLPAARLPNPSATTLGGVESKAAVTHQFLTSIGTDGTVGQAQPAAADVSGLAASAIIDTTNAANISSGTLPAARLPNPSATTLGGVESAAAVAHQWIDSISTAGVPHLSQPAAADVSGLGTAATLNVGTGANNIVQLNASSQLPAVDGSLLANVVASGAIPDCGRLTFVSTTQIKFAPRNGDRIKIAGTLYQIPSAGVTISNASLAASTLYYAYIFNNAGTLTLELSTTGHSTDSTAGNIGIEIKTGDNTRSLVGMIQTTSGSLFADAVSTRFVASWFNRANRSIVGAALTGSTTTSISTFVELSTTARAQYITWVDECVFATCSGQVVQGTGGVNIQSNIGNSGSNAIATTVADTPATASQAWAVATSVCITPAADGFAYVTPTGCVGGASTGSFFTSVTGIVRI